MTTPFQSKTRIALILLVIAGCGLGSARAQNTIPPYAIGNIYGNQGIITQGQQGSNYLYAPPPGHTTIINGSGGTGSNVSVIGSPYGAPTIGMDTNGLTVIQSGQGTGLSVTVTGGTGTTIGVRSTVGR